MSGRIYLEGGGNSKELRVRCREGFRKLLEQCGFSGRMPRLVACGSRGATYGDFRTGRAQADYVALLIDSEDPVANIDATWDHLLQRDGWEKPASASDEQVLLMTTCMETWIIADRQTLQKHYGSRLQASALPSDDLERRDRDQVQTALARATRGCSNAYAKGKRSFVILAELDPSVLATCLPSFKRVRDILTRKL